jgi:hypothetical protein
MYSVRHVVDIDFQPLGLKSARKDGGILGTEVSNLNPLSSEIEVVVNLMPPPGDVFFL